MNKHEIYMKQALAEAYKAYDDDEVPVGAVIVYKDEIIARAHNQIKMLKDPTAHAEMSAIRDAARRSNSRDLSGAVIYSSSRLCPMCETAAYWANISQMNFGHAITSVGPPKLCR